jgi:hypothetical protein
MGGSTRGRKGDVDSLSATLLLQHALQFDDPAAAETGTAAPAPEAGHRDVP